MSSGMHRSPGAGLGQGSADHSWMGEAIAAACDALDSDEVPVGAVIVRSGALLAAAANRTIRDQDPTAHAELLAIRQASEKLRSWRLNGCSIFVTLEPCAMCAGAIVLARVDRLVFGAWDEKAGMAGSIGDLVRHPRLNHQPEVVAGVREIECGDLVRDFFRARRAAGGTEQSASSEH
ncbi:MAG: tRNA adenosine(34) deaminase TadA [Gemmatimonadaceae bacterium]